VAFAKLEDSGRGDDSCTPITTPTSRIPFQPLYTGPLALVKLNGLIEKCSQFADPRSVAPEVRTRDTTVASISGTGQIFLPVRISGKVPAVKGTPAMETLSFTTIVLPLSPASCSSLLMIDVWWLHVFNGFSSTLPANFRKVRGGSVLGSGRRRGSVYAGTEAK